MKRFFPIFIFFFFLYCCTKIALAIDPQFEACEPRECGSGPKISYPFWIDDQPSYCGYKGFQLACSNKRPVLNLSNGNSYYVLNIFYDNQSLLVANTKLFDNKTCPWPTRNLTLDRTPFNISHVNANLNLFFHCNQSLPEVDYFGEPIPSPAYKIPCMSNDRYSSYATLIDYETLEHMGLQNCESSAVEPVMLDVNPALYMNPNHSNYSEFVKDLKVGFILDWTSSNCSQCVESGGRCGFNESSAQILCFCPDKPHLDACTNDDAKAPSNGNGKIRTRNRKIAIGVGAGVGGSIITCLIFLICFRYCKKRSADSPILLSLATSTNAFSSSNAYSSHPSSTSEFGKSTSLLPTHIYSYEELEEATNHFNPSKELGDGGFGTVYHGKLRDGRHVAVKRLYENNYRRVEQFMNEIDILSRLRHPNLVSLYGCTSRHSRELLLVYEYIPNGTIADHLHGNRTKNGSLKWPVRMSIAIETADALAYLHAVDIIHRDVKSNNILLDNNFRVKVADFGLSRLFPMDKTHVSTAPQGTPGYVDPDYHRCYQLNDKSDVYSFGVVLIELISSKPAVDVTRHRHDINLANMAINRIQSNALHELVDPTLGYQSDPKVTTMVKLVAELAFRCLQDEKEDRPSMEEVLHVLRETEREDYRVEKVVEVDVPAKDDAVLLKKNLPPSPDSVTAAWVSRATTPNTSG